MTQASAPNPFEGMTTKERNRAERRFDMVVEKVVASTIVNSGPKELLRNVYLAGLYHGSLAQRGWDEN